MSIAIDATNQPVIAYHHMLSRSLRLARLTATGFATSTLEEPGPHGDSDDRSGLAVVLQIDCGGREHIVYQRYRRFAPSSGIGLYYARIEGGALAAHEALPPTPIVASAFPLRASQALSFHIAPSGRQYVSAEVTGTFGSAVYYATR